MPAVIFIFLVLVSSPVLAIYNGQKVQAGDLYEKHTVLIVNYADSSVTEDNKRRPSVCSGVIVAADLILTASHCILKKENMSSAMVVFGATSLDESFRLKRGVHARSVLEYRKLESVDFAIKMYHLNKEVNSKGYAAALYNYPRIKASLRRLLGLDNPFFNYADFAQKRFMPKDLALLKINQPIPEGFSAASFYRGRVQHNQIVHVAGYGRNNLMDPSYGIMMSARQRVFGYYKYEDELAMFWGVRKANFNEQQICYGDSGGPMYVLNNNQLQILGIASIANGECGSQSEPYAWYVNPHYFRSELRRAAESLGSSIGL